MGIGDNFRRELWKRVTSQSPLDEGKESRKDCGETHLSDTEHTCEGWGLDYACYEDGPTGVWSTGTEHRRRERTQTLSSADITTQVP